MLAVIKTISETANLRNEDLRKCDLAPALFLVLCSAACTLLRELQGSKRVEGNSTLELSQFCGGQPTPRDD
jgi:hypothetical protein